MPTGMCRTEAQRHHRLPILLKVITTRGQRTSILSHACPLPFLTFPDVDLSESVSYHYGRLQEGRSCVDLAMRTRQRPLELEPVG